MGERELFAITASEEGWSDTTQIDLLLDYIENQDSIDAFADFLAERRAHVPTPSLYTDPADAFLWEVAELLQHAGLIQSPEFQTFCATIFDTMTAEQAADFWRMRDGD
ncbi:MULTISPECIES: hypothetical protein [Sphingomonadaceae]|uniref:hypothetical protein n=1 Tax=Sphingomonadales TaxID=204457 RepID=UPI0007700055|nr:hypothetical protein [Sphingobium sp. TKS]AMK23238.1 hypothetical protein K426_11510 [Sphingobium sp. TKS]MCF8709086.1 hypothetical protein [Rhizorhapis sp. SPR117]